MLIATMPLPDSDWQEIVDALEQVTSVDEIDFCLEGPRLDCLTSWFINLESGNYSFNIFGYPEIPVTIYGDSESASLEAHVYNKTWDENEGLVSSLDDHFWMSSGESADKEKAENLANQVLKVFHEKGITWIA